MTYSNPSNTIDFQRAKLVARIAELSPRLEPSDDLPARLSRKLVTTLDVSEQIGMFVEGMSEWIDVDGVRYIHEAPHLHLQSERLGTHRCNYHLNLAGEALGEITFGRSKRFLEPELKIIEQLLGILIHPLRNALLYRQALDAALSDSLTQIGNKRAFDNQLHREAELARRHGGPLSVILFDLDHFKKVNDSFGHLAGDAVLKEVAKRVSSCCRSCDMSYRLGGEEFAILLQSTGTEGAWTMAERIREAIAAEPVMFEGQAIAVSVSLGVATLQVNESRDQLFARIDEALYQAKRNGRNCTVIGKAMAAAG